MGCSLRRERIRPAWPGLRRLPGAAAASLTYGMVPPGLFVTIRERFFCRSSVPECSPRAADIGASRLAPANREGQPADVDARPAEAGTHWLRRELARLQAESCQLATFLTVPGRPNVSVGQGPARSRLSRKAQTAHTRVCCAYQRMRAACQTRRNE